MDVLATGQGELIQPPDMDAFRQWNREHKSKALVDKVMTEQDAISKFLKDGDYLGVELYGTVRAPMSLVREVIRQGYRELKCAGQGVMESDLLAAANAVKQLDWTYIGFEVYGLSNNARRTVEGGYVEKIVEWSNAALSWRFKAAAMGVPFLPTRVMLGTDTFDYSAAKVAECPFTGQKVCLLPALVVDVGLIHVHRADRFGNAQIDGISGFAGEMARASKRLIISAEEIVDDDLIRQSPDRTIIPYFLTDAVIEAPFGSHPGEMSFCYERDEEHIRKYVKDSRDEGKVKEYLEKWIHGVKNHADYLELVGPEKLGQIDLRDGGVK